MATLFKYFLQIVISSSFAIGHVVAAPDSIVEQESAAQIKIKPDKHNRRTPLGTVEGFLSAIASNDFHRATEYMDLDFLSKSQKEAQGAALAEKFQYLLDHSGKLHADVLINDTVDGNMIDGLDLDQESVGVIYVNDEKKPILLQQLKDIDNLPIWVFASQTVKDIQKAETAKSYIFNIIDYMPKIINNFKIIGVSVSHWLMVFVLGLLSFLVAKIIISLLIIAFENTVNKYIAHHIGVIISALQIPARLWLSVYLFISSLQYLSIPIIMRQHFNSMALGVYLLAVLILIWHLTSIAHILSVEKFRESKNIGMVSIVDFLKRCVRFILIVAGILIGLHIYDHNVTTGLAALGIGGLAIALGAQKTLENIAGSINVVADRSVNVGDRCRVAGVEGHVEEVGVRSTKIRTFARSLVTIPNAEFSNHIVENFSKKDKCLFNENLELRYETIPDQLRYVLIKLRALLYSHPKVNKDVCMVKLVGFGPSAFTVQIFTYINTIDYFENMDIREDLFLRIIDIVNDSGTGFAFPSQTLYFAKDYGLDKDRQKSAQNAVQEWRNNNNLQIPQFTATEIESLKDSISYPPKGSAISKKEGN